MGIEADPELDEALHRETEGERVEARGIAANDARPFESADSRPAGRFGKADCLGQFGEGAASILFQSGDVFPVVSVHEDRTRTSLNSSHLCAYRMPSSA